MSSLPRVRIPTAALVVLGGLVLVATVTLSLILGTKGDQAQTQSQQSDAKISSVTSAVAPVLGQLSAQCLDPGYANTNTTLCAQASTARSVVEAPPNAVTGPPGKPGRGVAGTSIVGGALFVTYSDGVTENKGPIVGANGQPGVPGRGVRGTSLTPDGSLVVSYSDGASETVGRVVGKDGTNGRSVSSVAITSAYHLVVTYSDGTSADVGALPPGPTGPSGQKGDPGVNGADGVSVKRQYFAWQGSECHNMNDFSDGTTKDEGVAADTACPPVTATETPTS